MTSVSSSGVAAASGPWAVLTPPAFGSASVLHPGSSKSLLTAPAGPWAAGPSTSLPYKELCGPDPGRNIGDHRVPRVLGPRG